MSSKTPLDIKKMKDCIDLWIAKREAYVTEHREAFKQYERSILNKGSDISNDELLSSAYTIRQLIKDYNITLKRINNQAISMDKELREKLDAIYEKAQHQSLYDLKKIVEKT